MEYPVQLEEFRRLMELKTPIRKNSELMQMSHVCSQEALEITMELNSKYHTPEEIRALFEKLTCLPVPKSFGMFPPFYTDCGKNIHVGENVFINAGCKFQDQGGIFIGDGALIGHNAMIATLNHEEDPERRNDLYPQPVHIGKKVWLGSNVTILPGVSIGDNSIIGAGSIVTKNIPANVVAVGSPAKVLREIHHGS